MVVGVIEDIIFCRSVEPFLVGVCASKEGQLHNNIIEGTRKRAHVIKRERDGWWRVEDGWVRPHTPVGHVYSVLP